VETEADIYGVRKAKGYDSTNSYLVRFRGSPTERPMSFAHNMPPTGTSIRVRYETQIGTGQLSALEIVGAETPVAR
jgi:hypothetical protein